ncbi:MAG: phosphoesterase [Desulfotignum sp.]|nr:phosphoesterase [Desulfobacteraceae bacterium]
MCIHQDRLPEKWMAKTAVIPMDLEDFVQTCTRAGYDFVPRDDAENNPALQQVIPYIVLQTQDLGATAVYNRQGSEKRLHDLWSLGIGGHINPMDSTNSGSAFQDILVAGMTRELDEELEKRPDQEQPSFCGIINENITDVGRVHLGAVFQILTPTPGSYMPGPELSEFQWQATNELGTLHMELWSTLSLDLINRRRAVYMKAVSHQYSANS